MKGSGDAFVRAADVIQTCAILGHTYGDGARMVCNACIAAEIEEAEQAADIMASKEEQLRQRLAAQDVEMANLRDEIRALRDFADRMSEPFPEIESAYEGGERWIESMRARRRVGAERANASAEYRAWRGAAQDPTLGEERER